MLWFNTVDGNPIDSSDIRQAYNLALGYFEGRIDDDWIDAENDASEDLMDSGFPDSLALAIARQAAGGSLELDKLPITN